MKSRSRDGLAARGLFAGELERQTVVCQPKLLVTSLRLTEEIEGLTTSNLVLFFKKRACLSPLDHVSIINFLLLFFFQISKIMIFTTGFLLL